MNQKSSIPQDQRFVSKVLTGNTIPLGVNASGLPVGAEVVGPEFSDVSCIQIAHLIEQAFGGCAQPPGFA